MRKKRKMERFIMQSKLLAATGMAFAFALPAAAQTAQHPAGNPPSSSDQTGASGQNNTNVRQQIMHDLQQDGFTNVQVMPESYLVRAKDKQGRPVMMVINPDSVTAITEMGAPGQPGSNQSGSSGSGSSGAGSTTTK